LIDLEEKAVISQETILNQDIYPKVASMVDRKQERQRRFRGCELTRCLNETLNGSFLVSVNHKNIFNILSSDASFLYRAEMAESMGMFLHQTGEESR
jgi:hypothetical protein